MSTIVGTHCVVEVHHVVASVDHIIVGVHHVVSVHFVCLLS